MKRMGVILLAALAAAPAALTRADDKKPAAAPPAAANAADDVTKADQAFTDAIVKGDAQAFDHLTTDDYMLTTSLGHVVDKKKNLDALKEGVLKFDSIDNEETKATVYGDAAVVTGLSKLKGKYKDKAIDDSYRWTRVWVKRGNAWLCATEQMSRVVAPMDETKPKDK